MFPSYYTASLSRLFSFINRSRAVIDASVHDPNPLNFINVKNSILQVTNGTSPANYRVPYFGTSSIPSSPSYNGQSGMSSPYNNGTTQTTNGSGHSGAGLGRGIFSHQGGQIPSEPAKTMRLGISLLMNSLPPTIGLQFKPSPYYEIDTPLGDVRQCEGRFIFIYCFDDTQIL